MRKSAPGMGSGRQGAGFLDKNDDRQWRVVERFFLEDVSRVSHWASRTNNIKEVSPLCPLIIYYDTTPVLI